VQQLLIGTYPRGDEAGTGEGVWGVDLDLSSGQLTSPRLLVQVPSPSFLAQSSATGRLFAVSETFDGQLTEFTRSTTDDLVATKSMPTQGDHPCHIVVGNDGVWVANYSSGTFAAFGLTDEGSLSGNSEVFSHEGSGPDSDRQEGPHAHFCLQTPGDAFVWVSDLGTDQVRRFRRTPQSPVGVVDDGIAVTLPPGTGPRHIAAPADGYAYVVGELDSAVHIVRVDSERGTGEVIASQPACVTPDPGTGSYPSHVALSEDGARLYVAVRGPDVLSVFAVNAEQPGLTHLADTPIGGEWPRHFAILEHADGDLVVVANQNSSNLAVLRIDAASGRGQIVADQLLPSPACVLPV
jgi:6-phosphogluconolactonase